MAGRGGGLVASRLPVLMRRSFMLDAVQSVGPDCELEVEAQTTHDALINAVAEFRS